MIYFMLLFKRTAKFNKTVVKIMSSAAPQSIQLLNLSAVLINSSIENINFSLELTQF